MLGILLLGSPTAPHCVARPRAALQLHYHLRLVLNNSCGLMTSRMDNISTPETERKAMTNKKHLKHGDPIEVKFFDSPDGSYVNTVWKQATCGVVTEYAIEAVFADGKRIMLDRSAGNYRTSSNFLEIKESINAFAN